MVISPILPCIVNPNVITKREMPPKKSGITHFSEQFAMSWRCLDGTHLGLSHQGHGECGKGPIDSNP